MEEQNKTQETESAKSPAATKMVAKIILGIVFILLGLVALIRWWPSLWTVIKGCVGLFFILAGVITIAIAKE
jgi:small-conductance mechanosensitive channel